MSEITLNFTKGEGVSLKDLTFTLSGLNLKGTFNVMTRETQLEGNDTNDITLAVGSDVTDETETATKTAIFFPQNVSSIELTVSLGSSNYSATLKLPEATNYQLLAGYNVEFEITVEKNALKTDNGSIIGWNTQAGTCATVTEWGDHKADEAKLYDLAMSDGTFITVWEEVDGTNKYSENIEKMTEDQLANVVGIVYYKGDPTADDDLLKTDHSGCTHGYILALNDMYTTSVQWMDDAYTDYFVSNEIDSWTSGLKPDGGTSIHIKYDKHLDSESDWKGDKTKLNKALGYNNTKLLRAYNYYYADYSHKVRPIESLDLFAAKDEAPNGSSGWYMPSPKELVLLLDGNSSIDFFSGGGITTQFGNIQNILDALGEKYASKMGDSYWSSSEYECHEKIAHGDAVNYYAWHVNFDGSNYGKVDGSSKSDSKYVRAVCAF
jgi:hypothetical protein